MSKDKYTFNADYADSCIDTTHIMTNTTNIPTSMSGSDELREKIEYWLYDEPNISLELDNNGDCILPNIDKLIDLFTHQLSLKDIKHAKALELAKIEAKIEELNIMPVYFENYAVPRIMELTKQKDLLTKENK